MAQTARGVHGRAPQSPRATARADGPGPRNQPPAGWAGGQPLLRVTRANPHRARPANPATVVPKLERSALEPISVGDSPGTTAHYPEHAGGGKTATACGPDELAELRHPRHHRRRR